MLSYSNNKYTIINKNNNSIEDVIKSLSKYSINLSKVTNNNSKKENNTINKTLSKLLSVDNDIYLRTKLDKKLEKYKKQMDYIQKKYNELNQINDVNYIKTPKYCEIFFNKELINNIINDNNLYIVYILKTLMINNKNINDETLNNVSYNIVKDEYKQMYNSKFKVIEKLNSYKDDIKCNKYFKLNEVVSIIGNEEKIGFKGFLGFCYVLNINIAFIKNGFCSYYYFNKESSSFFIVDFEKIENNGKTIEYDRLKEYYIIDIFKPFKSVGSYKLDELQEICKKCNIDYINEKGKSYKKQEIYNMLEIKSKLI